MPHAQSVDYRNSRRVGHTVIVSKAAEDDHAIILLRLLLCLSSGDKFHPWLFLLLDSRIAFDVNVLEEEIGNLRFEVLLFGRGHLNALN